MNLPGTWLLAPLTRHLDEKTVESIVVPTIADLQHETLAAGTSVPRRWFAIARGYVAILRLLVRHGLLWRSSMRRLIAVLGLGGAAGAMVLLLDWVADARAGLGALFFIVMAASVAFRLLKVGGSYRQAFVNCLGVSLIGATTLFGWIVVLEGLSPRPWRSYALLYLIMTGWSGLASALAATVAWRPARDAEPVYRRRLLQVAKASAAFAACWTVAGLLPVAGRGPRPFSIESLTTTALFAAYVAFYFAAIALVVYLPVMAGARRAAPRLGARLPLAAIGAALFPIPLIAVPLLQPDPAFPWVYFQVPSLLLTWAGPYIAGGAVLGWLVAERSRQPAAAAS